MSMRNVIQSMFGNPAFCRVLSFTLEWEGGHHHDPDDPGGETFYGISRRWWPNWIGWKLLDNGAKPESLAGLLVDFYWVNFWDRLECPSLPPKTAAVVFDTGVNPGTKRAAQMLQRSCGALDDGVIGPKTLSKVREFCRLYDAENGTSDTVLARCVLKARQDYYDGLISSNWAKKYHKGWTNRVQALKQFLEADNAMAA